MGSRRLLSFRWVLFLVALAGVGTLTALNIYSLSSLREQDLAEVEQARRNQLLEFANKIRTRFYEPVRPFWTMDSDSMNASMAMGSFTPRMLAELQRSAKTDSLFEGIYFTTPDCTPCDAGVRIQKFNPESGQFEWQKQYPELICDGIGLARTQMKVLVQDYKWNTRTFFDADRSMTIVFVDNRVGEVAGYLLFVINREYMVNHVIRPAVITEFGTNPDDGITVWVHDWARKEIIAASDSRFPFDLAAVRIIERFPGMLENWNLKASYDQTAAITLSNASLRWHVFVLIASAVLLLGSFLVIFIIAQRERQLALRQAGFLANVTHELKTPIAVMQAAGENLADGRVTDERRLRSYGRHIYEEAVRLRGMIDKLLDVAKSDAGQLVPKQKLVTASRLLSDFIELHRPYWESKGFAVHFITDGSAATIMVDPSHLDTVLSNLTDNAVKYSTEKKTLRIETGRQRNEVFISVSDEGRGIPPHAQKHVFEKFYRVEDALTADTKGHGLGLSIVKSLVALNGGRVTLKSALGAGSTFTLYFPAATAADLKPNPEPAPQASYVAQG